MTFEQRLKLALTVKGVHSVLTRLESAIDGDLDRLQAVKTVLDGSELSVQTETPPPRTREQIAVSENIRGALKSVQRRKSHPDVKRLKKKRRLAKSRSRFLDSVNVPDAIEDYERAPLSAPTNGHFRQKALSEGRIRFLDSLKIAKTP